MTSWVRWWLDEQRFDCELCGLTQRDGFQEDLPDGCAGIETVTTCPIGKRATLVPENEYFWGLFMDMMPFLFDGWGGCSLDAAGTVFDLRGVPEAARPRLFDKLLIVVRERNEKLAKEREE